MFALIHLISGTGTSKNKRVVLGNTLPAKKMAESEDMIDVCDDLGIESLFEHVLNRTEELLDENSNVSGEHRISTHVDFLERTVRLLVQLARIVTDFRAEKRNEHAWTFLPRSPGRVWKNGGISKLFLPNNKTFPLLTWKEQAICLQKLQAGVITLSWLNFLEEYHIAKLTLTTLISMRCTGNVHA